MSYTKLFDPHRDVLAVPEAAGAEPSKAGMAQLPAYVYDRKSGAGDKERDDGEIILAVNVALATGRPLLISGKPGTGKSTLAQHVARSLKRRYYAKTITSRTQARDLLWTFEAIRRLSDAHSGNGVGPAAAYVEPGILWWAFNRHSAEQRGLSDSAWALASAGDGQKPSRLTHASYKSDYPAEYQSAEEAVVLIDEIDKADPDVPNDLLEPLGAFRFRVLEGDLDTEVIAPKPPLIFITTNDERDLPKAFLRRCISLTLAPPDETRLHEIATAHFPLQAEQDAAGRDKLHAHVVTRFLELRADKGPRTPSTAEFLDAIRACNELALAPGSEGWDETWKKIERVALIKPRSES